MAVYYTIDGANQSDIASASGAVALGSSAANSNYNNVRSLSSNASSSISDAISSENLLKSIGSQASSAFSSVNYDAARDVVNNADADIANIRKAAVNVNAQADALQPYVKTLSGYGDTIWDQANSVVNSGLNNINLGNSLLNLNGGAGGISSEWVNLYRALSGDNQVSMAASDVQSSFQNAGDQSRRNMSRRGVSAGSGASQVLEKQYATSLATALAAAKTRARKAAIGDQSAMLKEITSAANSIIGTGTNTYTAGLSGQAEAGKMKTSATDTIKTIADIYGSGGSLYGTAGQLQISQGSALSGIQSASDSAHNAYLGTAASAYSGAGSIATSAASSYANVMNALNNAAQIQVSAYNNEAKVNYDIAKMKSDALTNGSVFERQAAAELYGRANYYYGY